GGEATRSDADALGTHRAGGVHVPGRVSDDHHPARLERVAQRLRTALGAATDERRAILGITAEASEGEAVVQSDRLELGHRALPQVPGAEPQGDGVATGRRGERLGDSCVDDVALATSPGDLLAEEADIVREEGVDPLGGDGHTEGRQSVPGDGTVGNPAAAEMRAGILAAVRLPDGARP